MTILWEYGVSLFLPVLIQCGMHTVTLLQCLQIYGIAGNIADALWDDYVRNT